MQHDNRAAPRSKGGEV